MYNQPECALDDYELNITQISKGRGSYLCDTSDGQKVLVPYRGFETRAQELREILIFAKEHGIDAEQIQLKKDGTIISKDNCEAGYILKEYKAGRECDPDIINDMCKSMKTLAQFHYVMEKYKLQYEPDISKRMQKKCNEIIKLKNYIKHKNRINEFERLFNSEYEHFLNQGLEALAVVQDTISGSIPVIYCHGNFNHHNIVCDAGKWRIINFETITPSYPETDIAEYMRKMMEKNGWSTELGKLLIQSYDSVRKLSEKELDMLKALLLFPEKFCKITNHYMNSRKTWISEKSAEKLAALIEQDAAKEIFLKDSIFYKNKVY